MSGVKMTRALMTSAVAVTAVVLAGSAVAAADPAAAGVYYVSAAGSDSAAGTRTGEMNRSISQPMGNWTNVTIPGITVTTGSIQVGLSSDANAGNWVNADDFSLTRTS